MRQVDAWRSRFQSNCGGEEKVEEADLRSDSQSVQRQSEDQDASSSDIETVAPYGYASGTHGNWNADNILSELQSKEVWTR